MQVPDLLEPRGDLLAVELEQPGHRLADEGQQQEAAEEQGEPVVVDEARGTGPGPDGLTDGVHRALLSSTSSPDPYPRRPAATPTRRGRGRVADGATGHLCPV